MAEQRPYRIAGTGNDRLWRIKAGVMLGLVTGFIVVNWIATQRAARLCGYAAGLGPPMMELPLFGPLYPPWQWIAWWWRWRNAPELAVLWAVCARLAVYPMFGITALAVAAVGVARQGWFGAVSDLHGSARWAATRDIRDARLIERRRLIPRRVRRFIEWLGILRARPRRVGVYLGIWRRWPRAWYLRHCGDGHVLIFAPTREGKGTGAVLPTLVTWPHSVLVHDPKDENWRLTAGARKRLGQLCMKFEPASPEPGLARFNPLAEVRLRTPYEVRDVQNIVRLLLDPEGKGLPEHWDRAGSEAFEAFILHCLYEGRQPTLAGVTNLLFDPARKVNETIEHLMRAEHDPTGALNWRDAQGNPTPTHALVAGGMRSLLDMAEKERASVISQVKGFLGLYRDPVVAANTAASDFHIDDLVNHRRPLSLYIAVTLADQQRMRPLLRLVLAQILNRLTEKLDFRDGRAVPAGKRPLLLLIDEFASLGRLELFADSLSLIAGYGLKACLVAQSMIQIYEAYGPNQMITSHCQTKMAYRAYDMTTAREISAMTGASTVRHEHRTVSNSGASVSEPEVGRSLLTPDEVMRLGEEEMLVFTAGHHAVRAAKLRHFRYPLFNQRVGLKPPAESDRTSAPAPATGGREQKSTRSAVGANAEKNGAAHGTNVAPNGNGARPGKRFLNFAIEDKGPKPQAPADREGRGGKG